MFSNGKFKNTIAVSEEMDGLPLTGGNTLDRKYCLSLMENGGGRHWVALEDRYGRYVTIFFLDIYSNYKQGQVVANVAPYLSLVTSRHARIMFRRRVPNGTHSTV